MSMREKIISGLVACGLGMSMAGVSLPVAANDAGAFLGGVVATKVVSNMERRTEAEEQQAAVQAVPAAPAQKSPEQRMAELDKLAAGGYITKEEYAKKKQEILDSM